MLSMIKDIKYTHGWSTINDNKRHCPIQVLLIHEMNSENILKSDHFLHRYILAYSKPNHKPKN